MSPEQSAGKIGKSVGEKLRAARIAQHYTQSQLAAPDFSVSYISAIERGQIHPSLRALEILAGRLGLASTQLLPTRSQQEERLSAPLSLGERDEDEVELALLDAEVLIRQGIAREAIGQLERLSTKRIKRAQQLQHRYLLGWGYFKAGQLQECDRTLTEAAQLARDQDAHYVHLRILNVQALAQAAMRNYAQALLAHQRCLQLLEATEPKDPFFQAQVYMSMGQHYTQLENHGQALEMFYKAIAITEGLASAKEVQAAYGKLSQGYAEAKNNELARFCAQKSEQIYHQEAQKRLKSELYHYLGRALLKGDAEEAREFLEEASEREQNDALTLASIDAHMVEWYFARQELDEAAQYARKAYELSQGLGDSIIGADALIIYGRVEYAGKRYKEGDRHFVAGLEMLERLGEHEELAAESVSYAELLEQAGKEHEAFTYFRRAFQSQQKLGK